MFELEKAIAEWRRQMLRAGIKAPVPLDELESHLREEIEDQMRSGINAMPAFQMAVERIGQAEALKGEFKKVGGIPLDFMTMASIAWIGAVIFLAFILLARVFSGRLSFLLSVHIFSLTAGYFAALLTGGFGIGYVICVPSAIVEAWRRFVYARRCGIGCRGFPVGNTLEQAKPGQILGIKPPRNRSIVCLGMDHYCGGRSTALPAR